MPVPVKNPEKLEKALKPGKNRGWQRKVFI
jgi:hypothetical protein